MLPGLVFLVVYTLTHAGCCRPVLAPLAVCGRLHRRARSRPRQPVRQAIAGLVGIARLGRARAVDRPRPDNFVLGLLHQRGLRSRAAHQPRSCGGPLIGLIVGFLMGDGRRWREDAAQVPRRADRSPRLDRAVRAPARRAGAALPRRQRRGSRRRRSCCMGVPLYALVPGSRGSSCAAVHPRRRCVARVLELSRRQDKSARRVRSTLAGLGCLAGTASSTARWIVAARHPRGRGHRCRQ